MVFSSLLFVYIFLPLLLVFYFAVKNNAWRRGVLLVFSLVFYAWGEPVYIFLMLFSALINYIFGLLVGAGKTPAAKKLAVTGGIVLNLAMLGVFKYAGFAVETLNDITGLSLHVPAIVLPLGISFYTFQAMTYVIDVYRENCAPQKSFPRLLLFITFFPQLVAGPIVRYVDIEGEFENRSVSAARFNDGLYRFAIGMGKKVVLANTCALAAENLFASTAGPTVLSSWAGILFYAFQIYFDFSGYSDMAIGLGHIFGFTFPENFDYPYISKNVTEYWRRWHMTLGSWFRDYLFYPVMRSGFVTKTAKKLKQSGHKTASKNLPTILALTVVWFSTGLWHGASWNYVLWGVYYGAWLILEKFVLEKAYKNIPALLSNIIQRVSFVFITLFGFAIFYNEQNLFTKLGHFFGIGTTGFSNVYAESMIYENGILLIVALICCTPLAHTLMELLRKKVFPAFGEETAYTFDRIIKTAVIIALFALCTVRLVGDSYNPFIYFKF